VTDLLLARQNNLQALEARFALRVASALSERDVGHDIEERLRIAREAAVVRARQVRSASVATAVLHNRGGSATLGGSPWWLRLASLTPLVVLALGLMLIDRIDRQEQIHAAAEIDAILLADELPPRAYSDPGFAEYLKQPGP
jgi:Protein of unknown function (DUF3619)